MGTELRRREKNTKKKKKRAEQRDEKTNSDRILIQYQSGTEK